MKKLLLVLGLIPWLAGAVLTPIGGGGGGGGDVNGPGVSVDGEIVLFDGSSGTLLKSATGSGVCKAVSGVASFGEIVNADVSASAGLDSTKIADGSVSNTEFQYIGTLSSNAQTQLNTKISSVVNYNTVRVDLNGNDSTCVANDDSKPCLTAGKAVSLVTSPASANRWRIVFGNGAFIETAGNLEIPAWTWLVGQGSSGLVTFTTLQVTGGTQEVKLASGWSAVSIRGGISEMFVRGGTKINLDLQAIAGTGSHTFELQNMGCSGVVTFKANSGVSDFLDANNIRLFAGLAVSGGSVTVVSSDLRSTLTVDNSGTQNAAVGLYHSILAGASTVTSSGANTAQVTFLHNYMGGTMTLNGAAVTATIENSLPRLASFVLTNSPTVIMRSAADIASDSTQVGNTAATETTLFSYAVPAGILSSNGNAVEFYSSGTFATSATVDKRLRVKFGATTILDTGALAITTSASWSVRGSCIRTGAATQKCSTTIATSDAALESSASYVATSETLSGAVTLAVTGEGTDASDVVHQFTKVKLAQ